MADSPSRKFRWKFALIVVLLGAVATIACWFYYNTNLTMQAMALYPIWSATAFALLWWWLLWSGLTWKTRLRGLAVAAALAGLFLLVMKSDRFDGAMLPKFSTRWLHPIWPTTAYLLGVGSLLAFGVSWKWRSSGAAVIAAAVALSVGVFGFDGFALKAEPDWDALPRGERSDASDAIVRQLKLEKERLARAADKQAIELRQFTPSAWLRLKKADDWHRWVTVDGLAAGVGAAPRAVFKTGPIRPVDWPHFRGRNRDGVVRGADVRFDWSDEKAPPLLWKHAVGRAWSSFAVVGDRAFTQEQRSDTNRESVVCYDFRTGTQIWQHTDESHFDSVQGGMGPRATPTVVGRRIYSIGATGVLNCLDYVNGKEYWERNILKDADAGNIAWGMAGSPLVHGNLVYAAPGGKHGASVIAYDRFTGDIKWRSGTATAGYSSPIIRKLHGIDVLLIFDGKGLSAYMPGSGRHLFHYGWTNGYNINVALPMVHGNRILVSSGYSTGAVLLEAQVENGKWSVDEVWKKPNRFRLKFNDGILVEKDGEAYVFGLDESILVCLRWSDGKLMWRKRGSQLGPGGNYGYGQMLLAGDTLIISAESGRVSFVQVSPEGAEYRGGFQGLNRGLGPLDTKGNGWNQPVLLHGRLLLRNELEAACFDISAK